MGNLELLNRKEVANLLRISYPTLNAWSKNNILKPIKLGTRVRYLKEDVDAMLNTKPANND